MTYSREQWSRRSATAVGNPRLMRCSPSLHKHSHAVVRQVAISTGYGPRRPNVRSWGSTELNAHVALWAGFDPQETLAVLAIR